MYIRRHQRKKCGKTHGYWELVESVRTARGPRQQTVAWLGEMEAAGRSKIAATAMQRSEAEAPLFDTAEVQWVSVNAQRVRVENIREFGGTWLGLEIVKRLGLDEFFRVHVGVGHEAVGWSEVILTLIIFRLTDPSSELRVAEHLYPTSGLEYLLGVPAEQLNDDRLYRALDRVRPHKAALETMLKERLGTMFDLDYDLMLYDVTSTYFEGQAEANSLAARGYSRDHRPDCKQVCIGLVVTREGYPLGYEIFAGNRSDATTLEEIVAGMETRYGTARRIWVMDRGIASQDNLACLGNRPYVVCTPRSSLRAWERELAGGDWTAIREGLEVKSCPGPAGTERFVLCRSVERQAKERAMHDRFETRIEAGLEAIQRGCQRRKQAVGVIERRVGRLLGHNTRAAGLFEVQISVQPDGGAAIAWHKRPEWQDWARLSEGCYLLRSNVPDLSPTELWQTYMQLTEAEAAFRIHKSDLRIRPVWHQKTERVEAHILVCFLAYVLWKTLSGMCRRAGLGDEPRKVLYELGLIRSVDVILPTQAGPELRLRCVSEPTPHQAILLDKLGLQLPRRLKMHKM